MKTSYLDYYKLILEKVRFDKRLWKKEYKKALRFLDRDEAKELKAWAGQLNYASRSFSKTNWSQLPSMAPPLKYHDNKKVNEKTIH